MNKHTMTDKEMLTDALSSEKFMTDHYNQYANECASPSLMNEFMNLLSEEHQIQHDVFNEMHKRGWYQTQEAPSEKVQQAKLKFSSSN
ncbi:MAG: spore coat protein [Negativibacillus sp.]|nr:spore coat protein [Negativibacillus sp.]